MINFRELLLNRHMALGGWVTCGAYTYTTNTYLAYGTFPECRRGGNVRVRGNPYDWEVTNVREIILHSGYFPSMWYNPPTDDSVSQCDLYYLWMYILKNAKSYNDFIDPNKNRSLCREYLIGD